MQWIIHISVYNSLGYIDVVGRAAECSMQAAIEDVQALPEYPTKGEVCVYMQCTCILYFVRLHAVDIPTVGDD